MELNPIRGTRHTAWPIFRAGWGRNRWPDTRIDIRQQLFRFFCVVGHGWLRDRFPIGRRRFRRRGHDLVGILFAEIVRDRHREGLGRRPRRGRCKQL